MATKKTKILVNGVLIESVIYVKKTALTTLFLHKMLQDVYFTKITWS